MTEKVGSEKGEQKRINESERLKRKERQIKNN